MQNFFAATNMILVVEHILRAAFSITGEVTQKIVENTDPSKRVHLILKHACYTQAYTTHLCSEQEAQSLFWLALDRWDGQERQGRTAQSIFEELVASDEFQMHRFASAQDSTAGGYTELTYLRKNQRNITARLDPLNPYSNFSGIITINPHSTIVSINHNVAPSLFISRLYKALFTVLDKFWDLYSNAINSPLHTSFSFADEGLDGRGVCYCSNHHGDILIPDCYFLSTEGYKQFTFKPLPFSARIPKAYFRGTDTGCHHHADLRRCQRVVVSEISLRHPDLVDAGITSVEPRNNHAERSNLYRQLGIMKAADPQDTICNFQYNIDIDGNSNSWSGLFLKMLSGGVVLKLDSPNNYRQWYYSRLSPWINYVPIDENAEDLIEKTCYLRKHQDLAASIGRSGRQLAQSLDFESQLFYASQALYKSMLRLT